MNGRKNLTIYLGIGISLFGVALYDPLGLLFKGAGLMVLGIGLICLFFGYRQMNEAEIINKAVESFEKNRRRLW
tara:strand:- start:331 stop:552 length:222 start_codon:yes stop_codon:yes gene_type:complete